MDLHMKLDDFFKSGISIIYVFNNQGIQLSKFLKI